MKPLGRELGILILNKNANDGFGGDVLRQLGVLLELLGLFLFCLELFSEK